MIVFFIYLFFSKHKTNIKINAYKIYFKPQSALKHSRQCNNQYASRAVKFNEEIVRVTLFTDPAIC